MAVTNIQNSCVIGALSGLMQGRFVGSIVPTDYSAECNAARAIADEFIIQNTASGAPLSDASHSLIEDVVHECAQSALFNTGATSIVAADYPGYGKQIYALAVQAITKFI